MQTEPQQQRGDLLALALEIVDGRCPRSAQVAHRLVPHVGHPHRGDLAGAQVAADALRVAAVGLHMITRLLRNQRRGRNDIAMAEALDQPVQAVAGRPRLVAERQLVVLGRQPGDELTRRRLARVELAEVAHLPLTPRLGDGHGILQLRGIDSDESFSMMSHDSPSLCEALPGPSG